MLSNVEAKTDENEPIIVALLPEKKTDDDEKKEESKVSFLIKQTAYSSFPSFTSFPFVFFVTITMYRELRVDNFYNQTEPFCLIIKRYIK